MSIDLKDRILFVRSGNESWESYDRRFKAATAGNPDIKYIQEDKTTFLDTPEMAGVSANLEDQLTYVDESGDMSQLPGGEL